MASTRRVPLPSRMKTGYRRGFERKYGVSAHGRVPWTFYSSKVGDGMYYCLLEAV
jgi:hypothetical protein